MNRFMTSGLTSLHFLILALMLSVPTMFAVGNFMSGVEGVTPYWETFWGIAAGCISGIVGLAAVARKATSIENDERTARVINSLKSLGVVGVLGGICLLIFQTDMVDIGLAVAFPAVALLAFSIEPKAVQQIYKASFAELKDVKDMLLDLGDPSSGDAVVVGIGGGVLGVKPGHGGRKELNHFLTFGRTRSGKGRSIIFNLLNWNHSAITVDMKGENHRITSGFRSQLGPVHVLHPDGTGSRFDPFFHLQHSDSALRSAASLLVTSKKDSDPIFAQRATLAVYAALRAASVSGQPALALLDALTSKGLDTFVYGLMAYDDEKITKALTRFLGQDPNTFDASKINKFLDSTYTTLTTRLDALLTDGIIKMTSGNDFAPKDFYEDTVSLYMIFPEEDKMATGKIFTVIAQSLFMGLTRAHKDDEVVKNRKILAVLDELANTPIPGLPQLVSVMAGYDVSMSMYLQSPSQLAVMYSSNDEADTIIENAHTLVFHPTANLKTQKLISELAGFTEIQRAAETYSRSENDDDNFLNDDGGIFGDTPSSISYKAEKVPLIQPSEVRLMNEDQVIIYTANKKPIWCQRADPNFAPDEVVRAAQDIPPTALPLIPKPRVDLPRRGPGQTIAPSIRLKTKSDEPLESMIPPPPSFDRLKEARQDDEAN